MHRDFSSTFCSFLFSLPDSLVVLVISNPLNEKLLALYNEFSSFTTCFPCLLFRLPLFNCLLLILLMLCVMMAHERNDK